MTGMMESTATIMRQPEDYLKFEEAQLAAASFLARYSGRTLEPYRHDLRGFFQGAAGNKPAKIPLLPSTYGTYDRSGGRRTP